MDGEAGFDVLIDRFHQNTSVEERVKASQDEANEKAESVYCFN